MKRFALVIVIAVIAAFTASGCSDEEGAEPVYNLRPVWESYSDARLLKFSGAVKQVTTVEGSDEESNTLLEAEFDDSGHLLTYNPTGIVPEPDASAPATRWAVEAVWYTYTYDTTGRLTGVTKNEVGSDPEIFTIAYGTHTAYIPAPFPLGDIEPYMLRGVTKIESTTGYSLTCNGATATSTQLKSWPPAIVETTVTITRNMPVKAVAIKYTNQAGAKGEEQSRTETTYSYSRNWLSLMESVTSYPDSDGSDSERLVTQFSTQWPCSPAAKEVYLGENTKPESRIEYKYAENGQPLSVIYTVGSGVSEFSEQPYELRYTKYDHENNWITAIRTVDATEIPVTRTLTYF